jgi:DNA-directed RNA polymerase beta subunit
MLGSTIWISSKRRIREVENGRVTDRIRYLSALEEEDHVIAQANAPIDGRGNFTADLVSSRKGGEFVMARPEEVNFMDVSPNQLVSVAASLIPFLENDDANRALMGSNMQRQAVPLLRTEAPFVGTGMEKDCGARLRVTIVARATAWSRASIPLALSSKPISRPARVIPVSIFTIWSNTSVRIRILVTTNGPS